MALLDGDTDKPAGCKEISQCVAARVDPGHDQGDNGADDDDKVTLAGANTKQPRERRCISMWQCVSLLVRVTVCNYADLVRVRGRGLALRQTNENLYATPSLLVS